VHAPVTRHADTSTLHLVRHAPTAATRLHAFPADEALDAAGRTAAANLRDVVASDHVVTASTRRCLQTAEAMFPRADAAVDRRWDELDFGDWSGRTMQEVWDQDPPAMTRWFEDPAYAPPGGESLETLAGRVGAALEALRPRAGVTAVVTSGGPIKVAVVLALGAPLQASWRVEVPPCSVNTLRSRPDGGWTLVAPSAPAG
jgi:broad specificity phosphatase PhoE